tara:strand:- start:16290 stop:16532 length:243 start_codon:yes stop_codon:yes gene_type:complete
LKISNRIIAPDLRWPVFTHKSTAGFARELTVIAWLKRTAKAVFHRKLPVNPTLVIATHLNQSVDRIFVLLAINDCVVFRA